MPRLPALLRKLLLAVTLGAAALPAVANTSGIAPAGASVTVKDNGDGTVTMANGIVSIVIEPAQNRINSIKYTTTEGGVPRTVETIRDNDHFRWGGFPLGGKAFVYSLAVDPATNGGSHGDVMLLDTSDKEGVGPTTSSARWSKQPTRTRATPRKAPRSGVSIKAPPIPTRRRLSMPGA